VKSGVAANGNGEASGPILAHIKNFVFRISASNMEQAPIFLFVFFVLFCSRVLGLELGLAKESKSQRWVCGTHCI
jgi:hypothetical protein